MARPIIINRSVNITNFIDIIVTELNRNGIECELEPEDTETDPLYNSSTIRFQGTWARLTFTYRRDVSPTALAQIGMDFSNKSGYREITKLYNIGTTFNIGAGYTLSLSILRNSENFWFFNITISTSAVPYPIFISSYSSSTGMTIGRVPFKENDVQTNEFISSTESAVYSMFLNVDTEREYTFGIGDATIIDGFKQNLYLLEGGWKTLDFPAIAYALGQSGSTTYIKPVELPGFRSLLANGMPARRPVHVNGKTYYKLIESSSLVVELYPEETP